MAYCQDIFKTYWKFFCTVVAANASQDWNGDIFFHIVELNSNVLSYLYCQFIFDDIIQYQLKKVVPLSQ